MIHWTQLMRMAQGADIGPDRVLVKESGLRVPPKQARQLYDSVPEIILVRDDGWMLGVPMHLSDAAMLLCENEWTCYIIPGAGAIYSMDTWPRREQYFEEAQLGKRGE